MAKIGAVILAAGESSRFGRPKQLIELHGCPLIERMVTAATEAKCSPVIVVTGSNSTKVAAAIADKPVSIVNNQRWRDGIGGSIRVGLQRLIEMAPDADAVVLLVCDQPFVDRDVIAGLIEHGSVTRKPIIASSYTGTIGVPALFDRSCFPELVGLPDDSGAKPIILKNPDRVAKFPFPLGAQDIDTMEVYRAVK